MLHAECHSCKDVFWDSRWRYQFLLHRHPYVTYCAYKHERFSITQRTIILFHFFPLIQLQLRIPFLVFVPLFFINFPMDACKSSDSRRSNKRKRAFWRRQNNKEAKKQKKWRRFKEMRAHSLWFIVVIIITWQVSNWLTASALSIMIASLH